MLAVDFFKSMVLFFKNLEASLKKNLNASKLSEHPPVGGEHVKAFRGITGCKDKTSWYLNGFPDGSNIGLTVSRRGETHRYAVHLH